ncbi:unnamed protein product [Calypogeia fissa]
MAPTPQTQYYETAGVITTTDDVQTNAMAMVRQVMMDETWIVGGAGQHRLHTKVSVITTSRRLNVSSLFCLLKSRHGASETGKMGLFKVDLEGY